MSLASLDLARPADFVPRARPARFCNLGRLLDTLEQRGLDGIVAYLRPNVYYLSGFAPPSNQSVHETNGYAAVVLSRHAPEQAALVVAEFDLAYFLTQPSWIGDVRPYATLIQPLDVPVGASPLDRFIPEAQRTNAWADRARAAYSPSLVAGVRRAMHDLGLDRGPVGFDDLRLARSVGLPDVQVVDAYGAMKYVRQVKTGEELDFLRKATRLNQMAIERTIGTWSRGTSWQELIHTYNVTATALGGFVRDPGAIVLANAPSADSALYMHAGPEDFVVEPGTHIMWDCHGTWEHYCWDGGKTWVVDDEPRGQARAIAAATAAAMGALQEAMRPGARVSQLQAVGRRAFRQAGLGNADQAFIFFHGLGLEHIDMEIVDSHQDWSLEDGMVVSAHLQVPGDAQHRSWLEEIFVVTPAGGQPFFTWDHQPLVGDGVGTG
ncbi:MAG: M24 family metallopeptidase [Chloroflexota bacterium]|nr:M24 family metallopeptidase [Chloroflexota bacterium]